MIKKIIIIALVICTMSGASYYEHNYTLKNCIVSEVTNNATVVAIDSKGREWEFGYSGLEEGDSVTLKMYDNYTSDIITDDEVKRVTKEDK
jgi:hypothetical protein